MSNFFTRSRHGGLLVRQEDGGQTIVVRCQKVWQGLPGLGPELVPTELADGVSHC